MLKPRRLENFLARGFSEVGRAGYDTQFLERYDASSEVGFERPEFDDSNWGGAALAESDYKLFPLA
ncbi:MAG: hypothetical protein ACLUKN_11315 [Bacilli bacterium]